MLLMPFIPDDWAYQTLRKLHKATMPVLKDTPLGPAMSGAGKVMDTFEKTRDQALNASNIAEAVVHRANKAAPDIF